MDNETLNIENDNEPIELIEEEDVSQGGLRNGDAESLGSIPSTSAAPKKVQKVPKGTRTKFVRPPTPVGDEVASDACESSCSQVSYASEKSTRSTRSRTRKRAQPFTSRKKPAKPLKLGKPLSDEDGHEQGGDSEPASPPAKQAKTRATANQNLPDSEQLAKTMQKQPTAELTACIEDSLKAIEEVANESRNLKGSFVRSLKVAAVTLQAAATELASRSAVEANVERLEKENADLKARLTSLSAQVERLTVQVGPILAASSMASSRAAAVAEPFQSDEIEAQFRRSIALEIGTMVDAKLAALESRLPPEKRLRPPLAADKKGASLPATKEPAIADPSPVPNPAGKRRKGKGKGKGTVVSPAVELSTVSLASTQTSQTLREVATSGTEAWSTVVGRKAKRHRTLQPSAQSGAPPAKFVSPVAAKGKKQQIKLPRVPTTAAITVSVKEGSSAKLGDVMTAVRQRIRLADVGIDTVGQKRAADGGMVLTIAGTDASAKADSLASRMRAVLAELNLDVKISRPTKRAEARIMDLDDAVTPEDVAAAIAEAGGCFPGDVKVGEIRRPHSSLGHVWVRGPLAAIKKLASDKRLRLGWTLVRVQVLGTRRMMCFRCLEPGHVRSQCTSAVDRSTQCYACGGAHKVRECTSPTMRCPICADQGLPANHRLGGKKCTPRKKRVPLAPPAASQRSSTAPLSVVPSEEMETSPSQP